MRRVGRAAAWGIPTWLVLLVLLPKTGMGALPCLVGATILALVVVAVAERRRRGRMTGADRAVAAPGDEAPARQMSPLTAAGLTLFVVLVVVYVIFVAASGN